MRQNREEYRRLYEKYSPPSKSFKNIPAAFFSGGLICSLGQLITALWQNAGLDKKEASSATASTLIFLGILLTGLGLYGKLARYCGAGTLVPITGFANSVASPAIEFKTEGIVLGTCVKMFTIAGPVLVLGTAAGVVYGIILYFLS